MPTTTTTTSSPTTTTMTSDFRALVDSIDASLAANRTLVDTALAERERLSAARSALAPTPGAKPTSKPPRIKPRRDPRPRIETTVHEVLREHPGHEIDVTVQMIADARKAKNPKAVYRIHHALNKMIAAHQVHKSPEGTLSLPASGD